MKCKYYPCGCPDSCPVDPKECGSYEPVDPKECRPHKGRDITGAPSYKLMGAKTGRWISKIDPPCGGLR